jgi:hypothetical protein
MFRLGCGLLELYPQAHRQRYGDELRALLEQEPVTLTTLLDVMLGALDAHLHPGGLLASAPNRVRGAISNAIALWLALIIVGAGFAKTTEDAPFRTAEAAHPVLGDARIAVSVLAGAASAIVVVAGAPIALSIVRQAWKERSRVLRRAVLTPVLGIAALALATGALSLIARHVHGNGSLLGHLAFVVWIGLVVVVAGACALCARAAIGRARLHPAALRLAKCGIWLLTQLMLLLTAATALYVIALTVYAGGLQGLSSGPLDLPTGANLAGEVVAMIVISGLALVTARRALRANVTA